MRIDIRELQELLIHTMFHRGLNRALYEMTISLFELDFWRLSARISGKDKIRNNIIKQKVNVTRSFLDDIKTKLLQWYGNVQRMEEGRLPKEVMKWRSPGRRKRGGSKLTWAEWITGLMGEKGLMEEDWNDRSNWMKII
jgi:hypothetical protein